MNQADKIRDIFVRAHELTNLQARLDFVRQHCGDDDELAGQVEALILASEKTDGFLESQVKIQSTNVSKDLQRLVDDRPGNMIGRYELVEEIGRGGFGVVFRARKASDIERDVAIKLIQKGMDHSEVLTRFNLERQSLALMDHPGIATIYDAGQTDEGRPYVVLEFVDGKPITTFCDENQFTLEQRLQLFVDVCMALQHAHQKGIIHRDLKPANILVEQTSEGPQIKLIDFGIAKAIGESINDDTFQTVAGQLVGTPLYMSPEQIGSNHDIDVRADIYSLGVILYELLAGTTPIPESDLKELGVVKVLGMIQDTDTPSLSKFLTEDRCDLETVAQNRQLQPAAFINQLKDDLDWIVSKALDKDRERRYDSAGQFADDIERFLLHDPVEARPPSTSYRLQKFYRKHRTGVITAIVVGISLIATTGLSIWQARRANQSTKLANSALNAATQAKAKAELAQAKAERALQAESQAKQEQLELRKLAEDANLETKRALDGESERRRALEALWTFMLNTLRSPLPSIDGSQLTVYQVLQQRQAEIVSSFQDDPPTRATLLLALGETYYGLGLYQSAQPLLGEAVTIRESILESASRLDRESTVADASATSVSHASQEMAQQQYFDAALAQAKNYFQLDQINVALKQARQLESTELQEASDSLANFDLQLLIGQCLESRGELKSSKEILEQAVAAIEEKLSPDHPKCFEANACLASTLESMGRFDDAFRIREDCYQSIVDQNLEDNFDSFAVTNEYGFSLIRRNELEAAKKVYTDLLRRVQNLVGEDHPMVISLSSNYGYGLLASGQLEQALEQFRSTLKKHQEHFAYDLSSELHIRVGLSETLWESGKTTESVDVLKIGFDKADDLLPEGDVLRLKTFCDMAYRYWEFGKREQAEDLYREAYEIGLEKLPKNHPQILNALIGLAEAKVRTKPSEAAAMYESALKSLRGTLGEANQLTLFIHSKVGKMKINRRDPEANADAIECLNEVVDLQVKHLGNEHIDTWLTKHELANAYEAARNWEPALELRRQVLEFRLNRYTDQHGYTHDAMNVLAKLEVRAGLVKQGYDRLLKTVELSRGKFGERDPVTVAFILDLAFTEKKLALYDDAIKHFEFAIEENSKRLATTSSYLIMKRELAATYGLADEKEKALDMYQQVIKLGKIILKKDPYGLSSLFGETGQAIANIGYYKEGVSYVQESINMREQFAPNAWPVDESKLMLFTLHAAHAAQLIESDESKTEAKNLFSEIEEDYLAAFQSLTDHSYQMPPTFRSSTLRTHANALSLYYQAWGKETEAEKWKTKSEKWNESN